MLVTNYQHISRVRRLFPHVRHLWHQNDNKHHLQAASPLHIMENGFVHKKGKDKTKQWAVERVLSH